MPPSRLRVGGHRTELMARSGLSRARGGAAKCPKRSEQAPSMPCRLSPVPRSPGHRAPEEPSSPHTLCPSPGPPFLEGDQVIEQKMDA